MPISPELLREVAATVEMTHAGTLGALRARFPGILFTECSEEDVPARLKPAWESRAHLYFLYACPDGHCLAFTSALQDATGIVVAARAQDEDEGEDDDLKAKPSRHDDTLGVP
jgi:hypothetical protein